MGRLVEKFKQCCLDIFDIRIGEKVCENMCNII